MANPDNLRLDTWTLKRFKLQLRQIVYINIYLYIDLGAPTHWWTVNSLSFYSKKQKYALNSRRLSLAGKHTYICIYVYVCIYSAKCAFNTWFDGGKSFRKFRFQGQRNRNIACPARIHYIHTYIMYEGFLWVRILVLYIVTIVHIYMWLLRVFVRKHRWRKCSGRPCTWQCTNLVFARVILGFCLLSMCEHLWNHFHIYTYNLIVFHRIIR